MVEGKKLSIILPCLNEHDAVRRIVSRLTENWPDAEIIVVDDGSTPPLEFEQAVKIIRHPARMGNGAAIKSGAREASREILLFMDSDGQHDPDDIPALLDKFDEGYDMVVGARSADSHSTVHRKFANSVYNKLASIMTGFKIVDLTSGFRAARSKHFRKFLYLLPNGFSYPTTSTMAFFRCGLSVAYVPIIVHKRTGQSKIRILKDGIRFFVIIMRVGALFSPMRFFLPISVLLFLLGSVWYGYTYITQHRFTNMGAVMYLSSLITFFFGLVSEQISALHYRYSEDRRRASDFPDKSG